MRDQRDSTASPPRRLRRAGTAVAVILGLLAVYSCSLIVENRGQQCQGDGDCTMMFPGSKCNTVTGLCVGGTGSSGSSGSGSSSSSGSSGGCSVDGGIDAGGCYACPPGDNDQLLNACSTGCIPFDNGTLKGIGPGGKLPDLPSPGPVNGM